MRALALLLLLQSTPSATPPPVARVVERARQTTAVLPGRVLDLAFADASSLLVLSPDAIALYRIDGAELRLVDRAMLPGPARPVRVPAGMLVTADEGASVWALTSGAARAALFEVTRRGLEARGEAEALPWPDLADGVRFRPGTSLLDAALPGVDGPLLRLVADEGATLSVGPHGELATARGPLPGLRVGPALAALWPGFLAAASAAAPGDADEVLVLALPTQPPEVVSRLAVPGAVRALAARDTGHGQRLAVAVEARDGAFRIVWLDMAREAP